MQALRTKLESATSERAELSKLLAEASLELKLLAPLRQNAAAHAATVHEWKSKYEQMAEVKAQVGMACTRVLPCASSLL